MKAPLKLLVGIDYSPEAYNATRYALGLAKYTGSSLIFAHIYNVLPRAAKAPAESWAKIKQEQHELELEKLKQFCDNVFLDLELKKNEFSLTLTVRTGDKARSLRLVGNEQGADIVLLGTHTNRNLKEKLFGGNTWKTIKHTNIPVMAVPAEAVFEPINNIAFASEGRQGEIPSLNHLVNLGKLFGSTITVLHVTDSNLLTPAITNQFNAFKTRVEEEVSYEKLMIRETYAPTTLEGLTEFCETYKVDWIAMTTEKTTVLERIFKPVSETRKMSFHTKIPLLSIPEFYNPAYAKSWIIADSSAVKINDELF